MDGNGRWAKARALPKSAGYVEGAKNAENIVRICKKYGLDYLTLFVFSSENWQRESSEVSFLMRLLRSYLKRNIKDLTKEGVKVTFIGDFTKLDQDIREMMSDIERYSASNSAIHLILAISYSGRNEIRHIADKMVRYAIENSWSLEDAKKESYNLFNEFLTSIPDPDLLIRTSGEHRISNFMLWQIAYTEFYFTEKLWPDFNEDDMVRAFEDYLARDRRYGK